MKAGDPKHIRKDLRELWRKKYKFNKKTLGLKPKEAREAADKTIRAIIKAEKELE